MELGIFRLVQTSDMNVPELALSGCILCCISLDGHLFDCAAPLTETPAPCGLRSLLDKDGRYHIG